MSLAAGPIDETSHTFGDTLEAGNTYFWKIVATDQKGLRTEGHVWSFTIIANDLLCGIRKHADIGNFNAHPIYKEPRPPVQFLISDPIFHFSEIYCE